MAYDNKPNLNNKQFEQSPDDVLNLSGCTIINGSLSIPLNAGICKSWVSNSGGTGGWQVSVGESLIKRIELESHGFNVQNVIGWSGGTYNKPIADGTYDGEVLGIVNNVPNTDVFEVTLGGYVCGLSGLSANTTYFLSDITAGLLSHNEPDIAGHISKAMMVAHSSTSGWMLPYAGYVITSGSTLSPSISETTCDSTYSNNTIFYSCDCGRLVYKDLNGTIHNLY